MTWDEELKQTIAAIIERKNAAPEGSAEHRLAERELRGLRYSYEEAGGLIESLDPDYWPLYCSPP